MVRLLEGTGVNANNGIISGVLVTVGDLARVVGKLLFLCFYKLHHSCSKIFGLIYLGKEDCI